MNPPRTAILLIDGDKTGDGRWYERFVPLADRVRETIASMHLDEIRRAREMTQVKLAEALG